MMNSIQKQVRISLSPSSEQYALIRAEYLKQTGSDNYYDNPDFFDGLVKMHMEEWTLENVTFTQAQAFAEPIRIANPDQCVSLYNEEKGSFIGNTSWNDQIKMFWEYPVYTETGAEIMMMRQTEAADQGLIAAWE
jgi:hypothetical protein